VADTGSRNDVLSTEAKAFYRHAMTGLQKAGVPFLVGGAYAFARYTGIERHTKDFDIFVHRRDVDAVFEILDTQGCRTELTFPHWLGKAYCGSEFVDVIFSSGNGVAEVDDAWFEHSVEEIVLDTAVRLIPPEEMIWSKAFIMERERYDGADIAHVLRARGPELDWQRLLRRFDDNWRVLLSHLALFGYVYPSERDKVPDWVLGELMGRLEAELAAPAPGGRLCQGTILSREQYLVDIERWGYRDARRLPGGTMTAAEIQRWTAAIDEEPAGSNGARTGSASDRPAPPDGAEAA